MLDPHHKTYQNKAGGVKTCAVGTVVLGDGSAEDVVQRPKPIRDDGVSRPR